MAVVLDLRATEINIITRQNVKIDLTFIPSSEIDWRGFSFSFDVEDGDGNSFLSVSSDDGSITTEGRNVRLQIPSTSMSEGSFPVGSYSHSLKLWSDINRKQELIRGDIKIKAGV